MSDSNGTATVVPEYDPEKYRPKADTAKVQDTIVASLGEIVSEAVYQAGNYAILARQYAEGNTAVRYGYLVDTSECLELAMTYLGILKQVVAHRLRIEDGENVGDSWVDPLPLSF